MRTHLLPLSAAMLAVTLAGCSSTSPTPPPPPEPSPLNYSAVRLQPGQPNAEYGSGTISGQPGGPGGVTVTLGDNTTYQFNSTSGPVGGHGGIDLYEYQAGTTGAGLLVGDYARMALIADNAVHDQAVVVLNGTPTTPGSLPNQTATYDGLWSIASSNGDSDGGQFTAGVDFDRSTFVMDLYDGGTDLGGASGTLQGTGFTGNLQTTGRIVSNNALDGQFYGSGAAEMGGLFTGTSGSNATVGGLLGTRQ